MLWDGRDFSASAAAAVPALWAGVQAQARPVQARWMSSARSPYSIGAVAGDSSAISPSAPLAQSTQPGQNTASQREQQRLQQLGRARAEWALEEALGDVIPDSFAPVVGENLFGTGDMFGAGDLIPGAGVQIQGDPHSGEAGAWTGLPKTHARGAGSGGDVAAAGGPPAVRGPSRAAEFGLDARQRAPLAWGDVDDDVSGQTLVCVQRLARFPATPSAPYAFLAAITEGLRVSTVQRAVDALLADSSERAISLAAAAGGPAAAAIPNDPALSARFDELVGLCMTSKHGLESMGIALFNYMRLVLRLTPSPAAYASMMLWTVRTQVPAVSAAAAFAAAATPEAADQATASGEWSSQALAAARDVSGPVWSDHSRGVLTMQGRVFLARRILPARARACLPPVHRPSREVSVRGRAADLAALVQVRLQRFCFSRAA